MSDLRIRISGAAVLIIGIVVAYFFAYLPYQAAKSHQPGVELLMKVDILIPVAIMFGVFMLIFGKRGKDWIQVETEGRQKLTAAGWVLTLLCCGTGIAFHEWLKKVIEALGYRF